MFKSHSILSGAWFKRISTVFHGTDGCRLIVVGGMIRKEARRAKFSKND